MGPLALQAREMVERVTPEPGPWETPSARLREWDRMGRTPWRANPGSAVLPQDGGVDRRRAEPACTNLEGTAPSHSRRSAGARVEILMVLRWPRSGDPLLIGAPMLLEEAKAAGAPPQTGTRNAGLR
jgi:hypothetical protein